MVWGILLLLTFVSGGIMCFYEKTRPLGKGIMADAAGIAALLASVMVFVANIGIGTPLWVLLAELAAVILSGAIIICAVWGGLGSKAVWVPLVTALVLCCVTVGIYHIWRSAHGVLICSN